MTDQLGSIGFYTLSDGRAAISSESTDLMRCELLVTDACNFRCPYCRSEHDGGHLSWDEAKSVLDLWISHGLKNIRFSGGEPTLWPYLKQAVEYVKDAGVERIAISTNGSAKFSDYVALMFAGVNDFSISFDACCSSTGDMMSGTSKRWENIVYNIAQLSHLTYITVGIVLTEENVGEVTDTVRLAHDLGVKDIRIIPAAQVGSEMPLPISELSESAVDHPILQYRLCRLAIGKPFRGLSESDSRRCHLVVDDMAVKDGMHYPCIIYLREGGAPIGSISDDVRAQRGKWAREHDTHADHICKNNCLDVCVDFNNRALELNPAARQS